MATAYGSIAWNPASSESVQLATLPLFHVTGMQNSMNGPLYNGSTIVMMTRWDRRVAAELIRRHRVTHWRNITTMAIDFPSDSEVASFDLSSLLGIGGGGAAMPGAVAARSEEHTSALQSLMRTSYAVFCLNKKKYQPRCTKDLILPPLHSESYYQRRPHVPTVHTRHSFIYLTIKQSTH